VEDIDIPTATNPPLDITLPALFAVDVELEPPVAAAPVAVAVPEIPDEILDNGEE
jgi:hypothetical protein